VKPLASLAGNFAHLKAHDEQLLRLGLLAERYFTEDPNTSLLKLRQLAELLAQHVATRIGLFVSAEESQYELIRRLLEQGILTREIAQLFGEVRRAGNAASHALAGDHRSALATLKITWQLGVWFHRSFEDPGFRSGPFIPPAAPADDFGELQAELDRLHGELATYQKAHREAAQQLQSMDDKLRQVRNDQAFWEQLAQEAENAKAALGEKLAAMQAQSATQTKDRVAGLVTAANAAAANLVLDEADTRQADRRAASSEAGWTVDSGPVLTYAKGARPEKGKNLAIAEWPTASGPPTTSSSSGSCRWRRSRPSARTSTCRRPCSRPSATAGLHGKRGDSFRTGRSLARVPHPVRLLLQRPPVPPPACHAERHLVLRSAQPENLGHALDGWYTPDGLIALLKRDEGVRARN
jgi:type I restriction enzyme R subunit